MAPPQRRLTRVGRRRDHVRSVDPSDAAGELLPVRILHQQDGPMSSISSATTSTGPSVGSKSSRDRVTASLRAATASSGPSTATCSSGQWVKDLGRDDLAAAVQGRLHGLLSHLHSSWSTHCGAVVGGIGVQGRMHSPVGGRVIRATLDKLAAAGGAPVWITELDVI
ncbi:Os11g0556866 [Oryza sativa Japonica Group]|uniref:Os11g0556866 protein n=1 Tax=Oryza sativa subsp. japonica TaxID=39947 RepID=A0A0P0Y3L7_ORYSJ|nr:Os11g0556866 [Oryza sativa Japonica Group]